MKLNEVRKLSIPADEGYGESGFPAWGIPAGGTLDFEIEVLSISSAGSAFKASPRR
jgi:U3 small nucleolar RNA-associated protein 21